MLLVTLFILITNLGEFNGIPLLITSLMEKFLLCQLHWRVESN